MTVQHVLSQPILTGVVHGRAYGEVGHCDADHDEDFNKECDPVVGWVQLVDDLQGNRQTQTSYTASDGIIWTVHNAYHCHTQISVSFPSVCISQKYMTV